MTVEEVSAKPAPPQCDKKRNFRDVCVRVDVPNSARVGGCSLIASSKHRVIFTHCIASQQLSVSNLGRIEGTARVVSSRAETGVPFSLHAMPDTGGLRKLISFRRRQRSVYAGSLVAVPVSLPTL
jgi:hypothetical protein